MTDPRVIRIASPVKRTTSIAAATAALGIVYGDLGTSPLYTYQAIVAAVGGHPSLADALGLLSLVVWALSHPLILDRVTK